MPTYEYSCNECGTYGSVHKSYDDDIGPMNCPKCDLQMSRIYPHYPCTYFLEF